MSGSSFTVPPEDRYFEDYVAGSVHELNLIAVELGEVIAFDPRSRRLSILPFDIPPGQTS